ncbi:MAG: hypothetical protein LCH73_08225 [Proteobacteria bacterium]|nr:hypothetical protein [Pseudomonadota bacterium]
MSVTALNRTPGNLLLDMATSTLQQWFADFQAARKQAALRREERELMQMIATYEHAMPSFAADLRAALARRS